MNGNRPCYKMPTQDAMVSCLYGDLKFQNRPLPLHWLGNFTFCRNSRRYMFCISYLLIVKISIKTAGNIFISDITPTCMKLQDIVTLVISPQFMI